MFDECHSNQLLNVALFKQMVFKDKQSHEMIEYKRKIKSNLNENIKRFYSYANSKRKKNKKR